MLNYHSDKKSRGLTLIETLIVLAVSSVILAGVLDLYLSYTKHAKENVAKMVLEVELGTAADYMVSDIRRSGFWYQLPTPVNEANPFMADATNLSVSDDGRCILFSYDRNGDGLLPDLDDSDGDERFGFRLSGGAVQARVGGDSFTCTADSGWENLTSPNLINITNLSFDMTLKDISQDAGIALYSRTVLINLTGVSKQDSTVSDSLTRIVRVRNHYYSNSGEDNAGAGGDNADR